MREHSIFISYRKDDGEDLAKWIHKNLNTRSHMVTTEKGLELVTLTTQLDEASASGSNWKKEFIDKELNFADSICIVCSPAAMVAKPDGVEDYLEYEITWWIENRKHTPPILVAPKKYAVNYIPQKITAIWFNPQVSVFDESNTENFIESIVRGITHSAKLSESSNLINIGTSIIPPLNGVYYWEKDRFGKYLAASEFYARAAGFDSPQAMIGKTDFDMPWSSLALFFQEGDRKVINGKGLERLHALEKEIMVDKIADILVHENAIRDHSGRIIGVTGCFIDVTGMTELDNSIRYKMDDTGLNLGEDFDNQRLDLNEIKVFQGLVRNKSVKTIAKELSLHVNIVESIIISLQQKLQGSNNQDIVVIAVRSGLPLKLFGTI